MAESFSFKHAKSGAQPRNFTLLNLPNAISSVLRGVLAQTFMLAYLCVRAVFGQFSFLNNFFLIFMLGIKFVGSDLSNKRTSCKRRVSLF